jgi:hypothetical protein
LQPLNIDINREENIVQEISSIERLQSEFHDRLPRVFQYYCLYGEPLNTNKLKSSKYMKFLRDSGMLLKGVLKISAEST